MLFESNSQKHFSRIFFQNGKSWDDYAYAHHKGKGPGAIPEKNASQGGGLEFL